MRIPRLSRKQISHKAENIIQRGGHCPPIPVECIIEREFNLQLEVDDVNRIVGSDDILGAILIEEKRIIINECLDIDDNDKAAGRYYFTCAHELGHWVLHKDVNKHTIDNSTDTAIFCRKADYGNIIEWQANYFAASFLMPEYFVRQAFRKTFGNDPIDIYNVETDFHSLFHYDHCLNNWHLIANDVCEAGDFSNVSKLAMILRLEELNLIRNHTSKNFGWKRQ